MKRDVVQRAIASTIVWFEGLQESIQTYRFEQARKQVAKDRANGLSYTPVIEVTKVINERGYVVSTKRTVVAYGDPWPTGTPTR